MLDGLGSDYYEMDKEEEGNEITEYQVPARCKSCADLPLCDLDFCLRWWH